MDITNYLDAITKATRDRMTKIKIFDFLPEITLSDMPYMGNTVSTPLLREGVQKTPVPPLMKPYDSTKVLADMKPFVEKNKQKASLLAAKGGSKAGGTMTTGDIIGLISTVGGAISEISNTISAAKATKREENTFRGFNEKALAKIRQVQAQAGINKSVAERELERKSKLARNTTMSSLRKLSSGINQLKAGDLAASYQTDVAEMGAKNELESVFGNQMLQLLGQEQQLLSQQDQMVMSAEERKNERIQQNRDNYYTNMAANIAGLSEAGQKFAADLNKAKYRTDFLNILPLTNPWGIGIEYERGLYGDMSLFSEGVPSRYSKKRGTTIVEEGIG